MGAIEEFDRKSHRILLDGEYRRSESTQSHDVIDPATENVIAEIAETTAAEIDAAVDAGHAAQKLWWRKSALERSEIMHDIANDLHAMKAELAEVLTREMGKPYKESADEVNWSVSAIRYYAETGRTDIGSVMGNALGDVSRTHVAVKYWREASVLVLPFGSFVRRCQASVVAGRSLDIEHLIVAPALKRRHAMYFDVLTDWGPALQRAAK